MQHSVDLAHDMQPGVCLLHQQSRFHCDFKPDNVLICIAPRGPVAVVADCGSVMEEGHRVAQLHLDLALWNACETPRNPCVTPA